VTRHIGIVACSAEGASLCHRTICAEAPQRLFLPEGTYNLYFESLGYETDSANIQIIDGGEFQLPVNMKPRK